MLHIIYLHISYSNNVKIQPEFNIYKLNYLNHMLFTKNLNYVKTIIFKESINRQNIFLIIY